SDEFPPEVEAEAAEAIHSGPSLPATVDLRDVPFLTIDPPGSMDLDQALALERDGSGYVFRYAIADVAAFVAPGGAIDAEARRRVVTVYLPDRNAPLHPRPLSEGAASLLPEVDRQAVVWTIRLDEAAEPVDARVERARVRSRRRLTYAEAQSLVDGGTDEALTLLREIGERRQASEIARGGVSLPIPDQQVVREADGRYRLEFRAPLPAEGWNAQLSLLAGMAAAELMLAGGVGVLRTLPPPSDDTVRTFRRRAAPLGVTWPDGASYGDLIRSLDADVAAHAALLTQAARLFRGAGYVGFDGTPPAGDAGHHAAVAAPYAHVTAPLRRLVDRFGNEIVLAQCAGTEPPSWAREALDELPALMDEGRRREGAANGMALDLVEAAVLASCEGEELLGVVTGTSKGRANVQIVEPAVLASVDDPDGALVPGQEVGLRVAGADVVARRIDLEVAVPPAPSPTRAVTGRP
ncbi:MAG TPA: RNB domain-containing ribonuclease, partial [Acidimicrobiales bacterium]|nr:RNB domain-containing ribonuclease [Acidimicrobiales bacterium]